MFVKVVDVVVVVVVVVAVVGLDLVMVITYRCHGHYCYDHCDNASFSLLVLTHFVHCRRSCYKCVVVKKRCPLVDVVVVVVVVVVVAAVVHYNGRNNDNNKQGAMTTLH